ncbi:MAG TPA: serine hydrolase domain-containing protein [Vicinamibacterales bacterium]|nr:serine hydrolase domain-containing protein [Vicinamibacterales bacterium]
MKPGVRLCTVLVALLTTLHAQVLPQAPPGDVGLSKERLQRLKAAMETEVAENRLAGGVGLIARKGKVAYLEPFGAADKEAGTPMRTDTIFRIYSMTKAVTGVAVMVLYEEGRFSLSDPVSRYLPEFATMRVAVERTDPASGKRVLSHSVPAGRPITILDLLRHTSGFNYEGPHDEKGELSYQRLGLAAAGGDDMTLAEFTKRLAQVPLVHEPGTVWDYSFSMDVLGRLVEVVSGRTLDQFFAERIFMPLRMNDTGFYVPDQKWSRLAALYNPAPKGIARADEGAQTAPRRKPALLMGGAGLMSTVIDYARFVQMLLNDGELDGARILGRKTVDLMRSDLLGDLPRAPIRLVVGDGPVVTAQLPPPGYGFGLTFAVSGGPDRTASVGSKGEYNWAGAAGTMFWIDPEEQMVGVLMIQKMFDLSTGAKFKQLAYQAIVAR